MWKDDKAAGNSWRMTLFCRLYRCAGGSRLTLVPHSLCSVKRWHQQHISTPWSLILQTGRKWGKAANTDTLGEDIMGRYKTRATKKLGVVSEPDLAGSQTELESERELNRGLLLRRGLGANLSLAEGRMGSFYSAPPRWTRFRGRISEIWNDSNSGSVSPKQRRKVTPSCWASLLSSSLTMFATVWWE